MPDRSVRVPVTPPIHIEEYPTHASLTWHVPELSRALDAVCDLDSVSSDASAVVDATNAAGRRRLSLSAVDPGPATTYVRVEPGASWTFAWERRTTSVCVLTGTPAGATVRRLHRATGGDGWNPAADRRLTQALP